MDALRGFHHSCPRVQHANQTRARTFTTGVRSRVWATHSEARLLPRWRPSALRQRRAADIAPVPIAKPLSLAYHLILMQMTTTARQQQPSLRTENYGTSTPERKDSGLSRYRSNPQRHPQCRMRHPTQPLNTQCPSCRLVMTYMFVLHLLNKKCVLPSARARYPFRSSQLFQSPYC